MPRRNREYDDDTPTKGGFPLWLILVLGGVVVCVVVCGGVGALMYVMYKQDMARQQAVAERDRVEVDQIRVDINQAREEMEAAKLRMKLQSDLAKGIRMTRDEFRAMVLAKTEAEVTAVIGEPDERAPGFGGARWTYNTRTTNPGTQLPDSCAVVQFRDGRVADVLFE